MVETAVKNKGMRLLIVIFNKLLPVVFNSFSYRSATSERPSVRANDPGSEAGDFLGLVISGNCATK